TTGIAGLTLGGGFGWLSRKYGLTIDNLESAEVVTATGEIVRASAIEHADLFWALRGGSGNFGVLTRLQFRLPPGRADLFGGLRGESGRRRVGRALWAGLVVSRPGGAGAARGEPPGFRAQAPAAPPVGAVMRGAPPLPFLPAEVHGRPVAVLAFLYAGDAKEGEALVQPLRRFGTPVGEHVGVAPFAGWQQAFDPLLTPGARHYWKPHNFTSLARGR